MNKKKLILGILILMLSVFILLYSIYLYLLSPISNDETIEEITIESNTSVSQIASVLKEKKLIKNVNIFKLYLKLNNISNLKSGIYQLSENMGVRRIVNILNKGEGRQIGEIDVLFKEGQNIQEIAQVIDNETNNTEEDFLDLVSDEEYINNLINEYWFLTDDIKNANIYYPLEGYLAPNTYRFSNVDVSVQEIVTVMLNQINRVLTLLKEELLSNELTIHEYITLASIVELEGINDEDKAKIAGVFYNRLEQNIPLQSCATACYATSTSPCIPKNVNKIFDSPYNTYLSNMAGKLPVGPIANFGLISIQAVINPEDHDYLFFVSDINNQIYFSKTDIEHEQKINELKNTGLWFND